MLVATTTLFLALGALASPVSTTAGCDATALQAVTDSYIAAQIAGDPKKIPTLTGPVNYTENFVAGTITTGILGQPLTIDHNHSLHDTTACSTYTELTVTNPAHSYVLGTQITLTPDAQTITKVETLVTDQGDWLFNASSTLKWASQEDWGEIPVDQRDTREVIQAAADAYANVFNNASVVVPWGTPCDRLEGGSYTGTGSATDRCDVGIPSGLPMTNRRYVIDEAKGSVDLFMSFGGSVPDSHEFRIQKGKIRYVHTLTVMNS